MFIKKVRYGLKVDGKIVARFRSKYAAKINIPYYYRNLGVRAKVVELKSNNMKKGLEPEKPKSI
jgi:hypothetical protein